MEAGEIANASAVPKAAVDTATERIGRYRWVICGLLFFATTVNYVDRQVLGLLAKDLKIEIGWTEVDYGNIVAAFNAAYAFGLLLAGRLMDRIGTRIGYSLAIIWWSLAAMAHALARTPFGFGVARAALGVGEAGNFPAAIKTVAEWFPKKERAFATGLFNAGSNVGAIIAPLTVPWIAGHLGWRGAFGITGAIGLAWLLFWLPTYRRPQEHPKVSDAELAHIQSDPPEPTVKIPWLTLFTYRGAWAFALGKFLTDSMWWFYMTWFPKFLHDKHGLNLLTIGVPLIVIYLMADAGSIAGGWLSSSMIKHGSTVNRARKTAFVICSLAMFPVFFAQSISSLWLAVIVMGLATAAHQGFSSNLYTLVSDLFPRQAVGSVAGFGGTAGYVGASLFQIAVGYMVQTTGNYHFPFICAASAYLIATAVIHAFVPFIKPPSQPAPA